VRASPIFAALCGCIVLLPQASFGAAEAATDPGWVDIIDALPFWAWIIAFIAASMSVLTAMAINAVDYTDVFPDD
jgi:hypothetical protein